MTNPHCRIGKVKLRGGADLHVLNTPERDGLAEPLMRNAKWIADAIDEPDMYGYLVVAFRADGTYHLGWRLNPDGFVGATMFPSYVADILRREMLECGAWA